MKYLAILIVLLFSAGSYANWDYQGTDFAPFPLNTGDIALLEGVWRGEEIDIKIDDSGYRISSKPLMWIEIMDHKAGNSRRGVMYYRRELEQYSLYMFGGEGGYTLIPIDLGVKVFSGSYTTQSGLVCDSGMKLLKIEFAIEESFGEVVFTKESCE